MSAWMLGITILLLAGGVTAFDDFFATFMKRITPGSPFTVNIIILEYKGAINCTVALRQGQGSTWDGSEYDVFIDFPRVTTGSVSFDVPADLKLIEVDLTITCGYMKPQKKQMQVFLAKPGLFVQTDKYLYKPGDIVKMRALCVTADLTPCSGGPLVISLSDPKDNIVSEKTTEGQTDFRGALLSSEFEFSDDPIIGRWNVKTKFGKFQVTTTVNVNNYVLPRFDIKVQARREGQSVIVAVTSKYTNGQPVKGMVSLSYVINTKRNPKSVERPFDGFEEIVFSFDDINIRRGRNELVFYADVIERLTHISMHALAPIQVLHTDMQIALEFVEPVLSYGINQETYTFTIKYTNLDDGSPFTGVLDNYTLHWQVTDMKYKDQLFSTPIVSNPTTMTIRMPIDDLYAIIAWLSAGDQITERKEIVPARYDSVAGLSVNMVKVQSNNQKQSCFKCLEFNENKFKAFYQILSTRAGPLQVYNSSTGHCFDVTNDNAPVTRVLVYLFLPYNEKGKEFAAGSLLFEYPHSPFPNPTTVSLSSQVVKPGATVTIRTRARSRSLVGLSAVDVSTRILAGGKENDLKASHIQEFLRTSRVFVPKYDKYGAAMMLCLDCLPFRHDLSAGQVLEANELGWMTGFVFVQTNNVPERSEPHDDIFDPINGDGFSGKGDSPGIYTGTVRTDFPETWIFELSETDDDGLLERTVEAPDTITNWTIEAMALSATHGLGIADPIQMTVFKEFFLVMNLPYSIIRHEIFELEILVFNYLTSTLQVTVSLVNTGDFLVLDSNMAQTRLSIAGLSTGIVKIPIKATKIGDIKLRADVDVTNRNDIPGDAVERYLKVKAEGIEKTEVYEVKVDVDPNTTIETSLVLDELFPKYTAQDNYVSGSIRMYLKVTGDLMGVFISTMTSRIKIPYGCGEQTMLTLTPSPFILRYLKSINRLDPDTRDEAEHACSVGYTAMMKFQHKADNSFSAFGDREMHKQFHGNNAGSTWLTAYVLRIFSLLYNEKITSSVKAEKLDNIYFYMDDMYNTSTNRKSLFDERGTIIHTSMQVDQDIPQSETSTGHKAKVMHTSGNLLYHLYFNACFCFKGTELQIRGGTTSEIGFTAFCLQAVMEYRKSLALQRQAGHAKPSIEQKVDSMISTGTARLRDMEETLMEANDPYQLAITAYTLTKVAKLNGPNHLKAEIYLEKFEELMRNPYEPVNVCPAIFRLLCEPQLEREVIEICRSNEDCSNGQLCCPVCGQRRCHNGQPPAHRTGSTDIEMNGYALLAYVELYRLIPTQDVKIKADAHMKYLIMKRREGVFITTQDTAVALPALAEYAITWPSYDNGNFQVRAKSAGAYVSDPIYFKGNNYSIFATEKLDVPVDSPPSDLSFEVTGQAGDAFVTVVAHYNVLVSAKSPTFDVDVQTVSKPDGSLVVKPCFWGGRSRVTNTTMAVLRVTIPSGDNVEQVHSKTAMKIEVKKTEGTVSFYYQDRFNDDIWETRICEMVETLPSVKVQNRQQQEVTVFDYYDREGDVTVLYLPEDKLVEDGPTTGAMGIMMNVLLLLFSTIITMLLNTM